MFIAGWEPLDYMIMDSAERTDKVLEEMKDLEGEELLDYIQSLDLESFTGNDLNRIFKVLNKKGISTEC